MNLGLAGLDGVIGLDDSVVVFGSAGHFDGCKVLSMS